MAGDTPQIEIAVTELAMNAPPMRRDKAVPAGQLALLRARQPTVSFYRYLSNTVGERWFWADRRALDDAALGELIGADGVEIFTLYVDGVPAGFAELDRRRQHIDGTVELVYLGLVPEYLGRGYGRYLLRWVLDEAWRHEPYKLATKVSSLDHPRAPAMLQRAGFTPVAQTRTHIDDPRATGLIDGAVALPAGVATLAVVGDTADDGVVIPLRPVPG